MRKGYMWLFVTVILVIPFAMYAIVNWYQNGFESLPVLGDKGHTIMNFHFLNQDNKEISRAGSENKIIVANFFFSHCPSICPKMVNNLKRVQAYAGIDNLQINSFTVDPLRDSVQRLRTYSRLYEIKGDWNLLTGDKIELYRLARKSFLITATDGDGGENDFIHSDLLVLIDTDKRIRGYYKGTENDEVNQLIKDIKKLAKEKD
jgi:protein SCO1/2